MSDYFIGDVQGCFAGLQQALAEVNFCHGKDTLWLTGDLVARGENSLAILQYLTKHESSIRTVLGNHDLHFLSVANGIKKDNPSDKLGSLLHDPKLPYYIDWIREQPLVLQLPDQSGFMSHAGLAPDWQPEDALFWSDEIRLQLKDSQYRSFLAKMYSNTPTKWSSNLSESEQFIYAINSLTRMRFCDLSGHLNFSEKGGPESIPDDSNLIPWFAFEPSRFQDTKWVFGHWAALMGLTKSSQLYALDTGYVWGNHLTILEWKTKQQLSIPASISIT